MSDHDEARALLAEAAAAVPAGFGDLHRRIDAFFAGSGPVGECPECGQDVPVVFAPGLALVAGGAR